MKKALSILLAVCLLLGVLPFVPVQASAASDTEMKKAVLELVNQERAQQGLPALGANKKLNAAADIRAQEIVEKFSHDRPDGSRCFTIFDEVGAGRYYAVGENIAAGQRSPQAVMESWMNSSGHRANILGSGYKNIGIGLCRTDSGYGYYWVQLFFTGPNIQTDADAFPSSDPTPTPTPKPSSGTITLRFDSNGGSGFMPTVSFPNNQKYTLPQCQFTPPAGKTFKAWELPAIEVQPGDRWTPPDVGSHTFIIKAIWQDNASSAITTIRYDANGGKGTMADEQIGYREFYTFPQCSFTPPAGKVFKGWGFNGSNDGTGRPGASMQMAFSSSRTIVVKAIWKDADPTATPRPTASPTPRPTATPTPSGSYSHSGNKTAPKMSQAEIIQLLRDNSNDTPSDVFDETPSCQAPYKTGRVKRSVLQKATNRLNALRKIAGVPDVTLDDSLSANAQYGAVIMGKLGTLSHTPSRPSDMDESFYQQAYSACGSSNIYAGPQLCDTPDGFMDDSDSSNISRLGHRRWQLNPKLGKVGFGYVDNGSGYRRFTAEKVFDSNGAGCDYDYVSWPASGNFPTGDYFTRNTAWSISLNESKFSRPSSGEVSVELTRQRDGRVWRFSRNSSNGYFNVDTGGYGISNCIIFRPDGISAYEGDTFTVKVNGLKTKTGATVADFQYEVNFFDPDPAPTPRPTATPTPTPSDNEVNLVFDANGGSGSMFGPVIRVNQYYRMPECEFTPPPGKVFLTWQFSGSYVNPGMSCTVGSPGTYTIKAIWKDADPTATPGPTATPTPSPTATPKPTATPRPTSTPTSKPTPTSRPTSTPRPTATPKPTFPDVKPTDWFAGATDYVLEVGMMTGMGGKFEPNGTTTRAQLVTTLYRLAGQPSASGGQKFSDVKSSDWFHKQIQWASSNGIVNGSGGKFRPNDPVSRQEFAAILYRYASKMGYDTSYSFPIWFFPDGNKVSGYAQRPMEWAIGSDIIGGSGGKLDPSGRATRAQTATMLMRFHLYAMDQN